MNNREHLISLMGDYSLDRQAVSELLSVKRDTVDHWLLPSDARNSKAIPDMAVELLELKMQMAEDAEKAS